MKTEIPLHASRPVFGDVEFAFHVRDAPVGNDDVYRLDIENKAMRLRYTGIYRAKPFSFVRLEDDLGKSISYEKDEHNPPIPYLDEARGAFIKNFPAMPTIARTGLIPFEFNGNPASQDIERTDEGLRFTLASWMLRVVIDWKRGDPWWSSLECFALQFPGSKLPPKFIASGTLLRP